MSLSQKTIKQLCEVNKTHRNANYAGQLTGLKTHRNANYATRKEEAQKHRQYAKTSRPKSICIYSLIIHVEISIQNISLVLSCEPHPKCKPKETYNYIKEHCVS